VSFTPASPVQLPASRPLNVTVNIRTSPTIKTGNYTINVQGVSGQFSQTANFTLRVVQYRVIMVNSAFLPTKLNVTAGSTVYWQNLDGPIAGCAGKVEGTGAHSVVFTTLPGVNSSAVYQFGIYKYTFTTPGNYFYYSSLNSDHVMNGTINVAPAAGAPAGIMKVIMPAFSHFKEGIRAAAAAIPIKTAANNPAGTAESAPKVGTDSPPITGQVVPNAHSPTPSAPAFEAGQIAFLSLVAIGASLAILALDTRRLTTPVVTSFTRLRPSDSS
jgi:plastocyanin